VIGTPPCQFFRGRIDGYGFTCTVNAQEFFVALGTFLTAMLSLQIPVVTLTLVAVGTKALDVAFGSLTTTLSRQIALLSDTPAFNTLKTIAAHDGGFPMYRLARFADVGAPHADPQENENGKGQQDRGSTHGTLGRSQVFRNTSVVNALAGGIEPLCGIKIDYEGNEVKKEKVFKPTRRAGSVTPSPLPFALPNVSTGGDYFSSARE
jgi:hypothetical protein